MGFLSSLGGIGGAIMTGLGVATGNPALIGAGLATTGVSGVLSSNEASKKADRLYSQAEKSGDLQAQIAADQWRRYKEIYDPLERERAKAGLDDVKLYEKYRPMVEEYYKEAQQGITPEELARTSTANVQSSFAKAKSEVARSLGRYGLTPMLSSTLSNLARDEALATAGAKTNAYLQAKDINFARLGQGVNILRGLSPAVPIPSASQSVSSFGDSANTLANLANIASRNASAGYTSGINLGLQGLQMLSQNLPNFNLFGSPSTTNLSSYNTGYGTIGASVDSFLLPSSYGSPGGFGITMDNTMPLTTDVSGGFNPLSSYSLPINF